MFAGLDKEITQMVKGKRGLVLGLVHTEVEVHQHFAESLLNDLKQSGINKLFIELPEDAHKVSLESARTMFKEEGCEDDGSKKESLRKLCARSPTIPYVALYAQLVLDMEVVPADLPLEEIMELHKIIYPSEQGGVTPEMQYKALAQRRKVGNAAMIQSVQKSLAPEDRYILLCGPEHVELASKLGVDSLVAIADESRDQLGWMTKIKGTKTWSYELEPLSSIGSSSVLSDTEEDSKSTTSENSSSCPLLEAKKKTEETKTGNEVNESTSTDKVGESAGLG